MRAWALWLVVCLGLVPAVPAAGGNAGAGTEAPPVLQASELAPPDLLAGEGFAVDGTVPTDGFYGVFTVRNPYGAVPARGVAMLRVRDMEMQALARLEEVSRREAVMSGARGSVEQTVQGAGELVQDPVGTLESVPGNVGSLFSRLGGRLEKRVGQLTGSSEGSAPAGEREGIAKARRELARQLQVDPYTDNPLLSPRLDEVARWMRAGQIGVSVATGAACVWAGIAKRTADVVWQKPPEEVRAYNEKRLSAWAPAPGKEQIRAFLDNPAFTPTSQTLLVEALEALPVKQGRDQLVRLAGEMETRDQARFLVAAVEQLAAYSEHVSPLSSVGVRGRLAVGLAPGGALVVPAPVDCLAWTDHLLEFGHRGDLHGDRREILISGFATPLAKQELSARGWKVREGFRKDAVLSGTTAP